MQNLLIGVERLATSNYQFFQDFHGLFAFNLNV